MDIKIEFWGKVDDERLTYTEMDDAIESIIDGTDDIEDLPETIEVCGFARIEPSMKNGAEVALERLLENLDEEYSDPDGSYTDPTDAMIEASEMFVAVVLKEYKCWACEPVKWETVNVQAWIKENRPDWLKDKDNEEAKTEIC